MPNHTAIAGSELQEIASALMDAFASGVPLSACCLSPVDPHLPVCGVCGGFAEMAN